MLLIIEKSGENDEKHSSEWLVNICFPNKPWFLRVSSTSILKTLCFNLGQPAENDQLQQFLQIQQTPPSHSMVHTHQFYYLSFRSRSAVKVFGTKELTRAHKTRLSTKSSILYRKTITHVNYPTHT